MTPADLIEACLNQDNRFGRAQFLQMFWVVVLRVFDAQQCFIGVYADAMPDWSCVSPSACSSNICQVPRSSDWQWKGNDNISIISDWSLQCSSPIIRGLGTSFFFGGSIVGGLLFPPLSDSSFGRRRLLFLSSFMMCLVALTTIFATNIWSYAVIRFVTGLCRASIGSTTLVLITEKVGQKWRGAMVIACYTSYAVGCMTLTGIAYILRDHNWKTLYMVTSIPGVVYSFLAYFLVLDSPAWLLMQRKGSEALATLEELTPWIDYNSNNAIYKTISEQKKNINQVNLSMMDSVCAFYSSVKTLFTEKLLRTRLILVMIMAFGIGVVYYGIPLAVSNFGSSIYIISVLNAAIEIPSFIITIFLNQRVPRRWVLLIFCTLSGVLSVTCVFISGIARLVVELGAFLCGCVACNVISIYTTELFPVNVRNTATALLWEAIMVAAIPAPVLINLGKQHKFLSYGIFGLCIAVCGLFSIALPKTGTKVGEDTEQGVDQELDETS